MDRAVVALEAVVMADPTYKDSLTYLGRAYYRKGRYQDAFAILQRASAVNPDNEIAVDSPPRLVVRSQAILIPPLAVVSAA